MSDSKYVYAREILFNLKSCNAITDNVYQHMLDKIKHDEQVQNGRISSIFAQLSRG